MHGPRTPARKRRRFVRIGEKTQIDGRMAKAHQTSLKVYANMKSNLMYQRLDVHHHFILLVFCTACIFSSPKPKLGGCKAATAAALPRCDVIAKVLRGHVETRHLDRRLSLEIFPHRWGRNEWPIKIRWILAGFSRISQVKRPTSEFKIWTLTWDRFLLRVENSDPEGAETKSPPLPNLFLYKYMLKTKPWWLEISNIIHISCLMPSLQGSIKGQSFLPSSFESGFQRRTSQALATGLGKEIHGVKIPWRS